MEEISIYVVVVLYKQLPTESSTLRTLLSAISRVQQESNASLNIHILVYDNTPGRRDVDPMYGIEYYAAGENLGLAEAYNFACSRAREQGFEWLLTLDQDSYLPEDFLTAAILHLQSVQDRSEVAALTPQILYQGKVLSPYRLIYRGARAKWFPLGYQSISDVVYALNSGSILRLSALRQANDYDPRFPLDVSDTAMFHRLAALGKKVLIAGDIQIEHDFSIKGNKRRVPPDRYRSIVEAESAFCDLYLGNLASLSCNARLFARLFFYIGAGDRPLRSITGQMIFLRLLHSRRYRLQRWESDQAAKISNSSRPETPKNKISVCMTTYNGESYVEEQIRSILPQLGQEDELIIVDDHSQDQTVNKIMALKSDKIRLIRHIQNTGAVRSFEDAIRNATGDIIFLSDMDDVWSPNKVRKIMDVFEDCPNITLVTTAVALIDGKGDRLEGTPASLQQARFKSGVIANLIQNRYQGSAMAFRSKLLPAILPIPGNKLFFHDVWIGMQNAAHGGKAVFLPEPLLFYRRHGENLSRTFSRINQVRVRAQLGWAFMKSLFRTSTLGRQGMLR